MDIGCSLYVRFLLSSTDWVQTSWSCFERCLCIGVPVSFFSKMHDMGNLSLSFCLVNEKVNCPFYWYSLIFSGIGYYFALKSIRFYIGYVTFISKYVPKESGVKGIGCALRCTFVTITIYTSLSATYVKTEAPTIHWVVLRNKWLFTPVEK